MGLTSLLIAGALGILGIGAGVYFGLPWLLDKARAAVGGVLSSATDAGKAILAAPGKALDYLKDSHSAASGRAPTFEMDSPFFGKQQIGGYWGKEFKRLTDQASAGSPAIETTGGRSVADEVKRLQGALDIMSATGQPYQILDAGTPTMERITRSEASARLAKIGQGLGVASGPSPLAAPGNLDLSPQALKKLNLSLPGVL